jgi:hypothetical protein
MIDKTSGPEPVASGDPKAPQVGTGCRVETDVVSRGQEPAILGRQATATSLVLSPLLCLGQEQGCQFFDMIISDQDNNCSQGGVAAIKSRCISHSPFLSCLYKPPVHFLPQGAWLGSSGYFRTLRNFLSHTKLSLLGLSQVKYWDQAVDNFAHYIRFTLGIWRSIERNQNTTGKCVLAYSRRKNCERPIPTFSYETSVSCWPSCLI